MKRRLVDPVSESYINALTMVKEFSFNPELKRDRRRAEITNDQTFLEHITDNPVGIKTSIPRIAELYRLHRNDADLELYTRDTCAEFHRLLVDLLESFKKSIHGLSTSAESKNYQDFKSHSNTALLTGYALLTMAKGRAFQMHLQTIEDLLMDISRSMPMAKKEEEEGEEEHSEELNEELETIQQRTEGPKPLRKIYRDWLQLMVVYFNAVDVLFGYVTRHSFQAFSSKILVPPTVDTDLLTLEELLTGKDLSKSFPQLDRGNPSGQTNEQLSKFITDTMTSYNQANSVARLAASALKCWADRKFPEAVAILKRIKGASDIVTEADGAIGSLDQPDSERNLDSVADNILTLTTGLRDKRDDLRSLFPFKFPSKFTGALHCEACLASMLSPITRDLTKGDRSYDEIYMELQVDYPLRLLFVIRSSFLVIIGLWRSYRRIKTLLPSVPLLPLPLQVRR